MKKILLLILIICLFPLCGCYDAKDVDDLAYALALGIDVTEENDYNFTFQLAAPLNIKGGVETGFSLDEEGKPLINYSANGNDFFESFIKVNDKISKELDLSQLKLILISEDAFNKRSQNIKAFFENERLFRDNIYLAICTGNAKNCLEHTVSPLELNPAKYYELIFSKDFGERIVTTSLWDFLNKKSYPVPLFVPTFEGLVPNGTYIISDNKICSHFTENETYFYNMLSGNLKASRYKNYILTLETTPYIKTDFNEKTALCSVRIKGQNESGKQTEIEKELKNGLDNVLNKLKTSNADTLNIVNSQKKYFLNNSEFKKSKIDIKDLELKAKLIYRETNEED